MSEPWPSDEHLINVLTIRGEFIATCRCGWKHSSANMKEHMAAVMEHLEPKEEAKPN